MEEKAQWYDHVVHDPVEVWQVLFWPISMLSATPEVLFRECRCAALPELTQVVVPQDLSGLHRFQTMPGMMGRENTMYTDTDIT